MKKSERTLLWTMREGLNQLADIPNETLNRFIASQELKDVAQKLFMADYTLCNIESRGEVVGQCEVCGCDIHEKDTYNDDQEVIWCKGECTKSLTQY